VSDQTAGPGGAPADEPGDPFDIVLDEDFIRAATIKESETQRAVLEARHRELEAEHDKQRQAATRARQAPPREQRRPAEHGERWRALVIAAISIAVVATFGMPRLFGGQTASTAASPAKSSAAVAAVPLLTSAPTTGSMAAITPSLDSSRAAMVDKPWPAITTDTAFPDQTVQLGPSLVVLKVAATAQDPCDGFSSEQMADLIDKGSGCSQLLTALYTSSDDKAQFTIDVLTMDKAEDASTVVAMAKLMPMTYQMGSMDPPPGSGVPTVPVGNGGVTESVMAVRSIVFVNAQWLDPKNQDSATLTADSTSLLHYVDAKVSAYEQAQVQN
jgi:hypothetical protein